MEPTDNNKKPEKVKLNKDNNIEHEEIKKEGKKEEEMKEGGKTENNKGTEDKNIKANIEKKSEENEKEEILIGSNIFPRGLNNIGATCYMNSVLQCFYHVFELTNELLKLKNIDEAKMPMTSAYIQTINELSFSKYSSISPFQFKKIISNNEIFSGFEACDSKTLSLYFMDTINDEFNNNNIKIKNKKISNRIRNLKEKETEDIVKIFNKQHNSIISDLFKGLKSTTYKCLKCNDASITYQIFNLLNFPIEITYNELHNNEKNKNKKLDILDCFNNEVKQNYFIEDNQLFCNKCNSMCDGISFNKIYIAPKIMILFLDRGRYNVFRCDVTFPERLNISKFEEKNIGEYNLIGVIEHLGPSNNGGHFIANCKHFDGKWYIFSDSTILGPSDKYRNYGIPYLLFYRREE